jgi:hypothetical protein
MMIGYCSLSAPRCINMGSGCSIGMTRQRFSTKTPAEIASMLLAFLAKYRRVCAYGMRDQIIDNSAVVQKPPLLTALQHQPATH